MENTCEICKAPASWITKRCDAHYRCDDCKTDENLCCYGGDDGVLCEACHSVRVEKRVAAFDGDIDGTPEIVCPWCGYKTGDSWEHSEGEDQCDDCGRRYGVARETEVTYYTIKIEAQKDDVTGK